MPFEQGPYLSAAFICERLLVESDGVKSAIRIVDRVTRTVVGDTPPVVMEPFEYEAALLVRFKSGRARASMTLMVRMVRPDGQSVTPIAQPLYFEGEDDRGVDVIGRVAVRVEEPGLHWFDVFLEDDLVTRIPLRVVYQPLARRNAS